MKYTTAIIAVSAAAANAQFTINPNGSFTCNSTATANFCVSDSLGSPIIMHCVDGVGEAGNCSDELAGESPYDVGFGECWQTSATSGDAACAKNCVVYPPNGTPFTLPASLCTPSEKVISTPSPSAASLSSTITSLSSSATSLTGSTTTTSTGTSVYASSGVTVTATFTTTWCPESTLSTIILPSSSASILYPSNGTTPDAGTGSVSGSGAAATGTGSSPTGSGSGISNNGTVTSPPGGNGGSGGSSGSGSSPTATPVSPKTTGTSTPFTGAATTKSASAALAVLGLAIAYLL